MRKSRTYPRVDDRNDNTGTSDSSGVKTAHIGHGIVNEICIWFDCGDPLDFCAAERLKRVCSKLIRDAGTKTSSLRHIDAAGKTNLFVLSDGSGTDDVS